MNRKIDLIRDSLATLILALQVGGEFANPKQ